MKKGFAVIVAGLVLFLISIPIVNDFTASNVAKQLKDIPLPEKTSYIESISKAGKLTGNGNGMQYLGCILIRSDLTLEQLREYYAAFSENEWECIVEQQKDNEIPFVDHSLMTFKTDIGGDGFYVVYSWGDGNEFFSELDLRGH